jgi:hypothetical protein
VDSRCVMYPGSAAPLFHFIGRQLEAAGREVVVASLGVPPGEATLVVAFGEACRLAAVVPNTPGVWLSPDFGDDTTSEALAASSGPGLVVGSFLDPGWDRAAAARLRQFEILQVPHVDRHFEAIGDPAATLHVYARIIERVSALVRRV